jgi:hypothetical protein
MDRRFLAAVGGVAVAGLYLREQTERKRAAECAWWGFWGNNNKNSAFVFIKPQYVNKSSFECLILCLLKYIFHIF